MCFLVQKRLCESEMPSGNENFISHFTDIIVFVSQHSMCSSAEFYFLMIFDLMVYDLSLSFMFFYKTPTIISILIS